MRDSSKRWLVWGLVAALGVLHYDFWFWSDRTLVFGFLPVGLLYHASISALAGVVWALVVRHAWPSGIEAWAGGGAEAGGGERDGT